MAYWRTIGIISAMLFLVSGIIHRPDKANEFPNCSPSAQNCPNSSTCVNTPHGYYCVCKRGLFNFKDQTNFTYPGGKCVTGIIHRPDKANEFPNCSPSAQNCPNSSTCVITTHGYYCVCKRGLFNFKDQTNFTYPGGKCVTGIIHRPDKANEFPNCSPSAQNCPNSSTCVITTHGYYCVCKRGLFNFKDQTNFTYPGGKCVTVPPFCSKNGSNLTCSCQPGFNVTKENGRYYCTNISAKEVNDPPVCPKKEITNGTVCDKNNKICPTSDDCNEPFSTCPCVPGFQTSYVKHGNRNVTQCDDKDECKLQKHQCGARAECKNTQGGYYCVCDSGFRKGDDTTFCPSNNTAENACTDIHECEENPNICGLNKRCSNTLGAYECICKPGFLNISNTCKVKCRQENESQSQCDTDTFRCRMNKFLKNFIPSCNKDSSPDGLKFKDFLDQLDMDNSIFGHLSNDTEQRLNQTGEILKQVEATVQNLAILQRKAQRIRGRKTMINIGVINRTSESRNISMNNHRSSIILSSNVASENSETFFGSVEYGNLFELLKDAPLRGFDSQKEKKELTLVSPVVSVFLGFSDASNLSEPILLQFIVDRKTGNPNNMHCVFWEDGAWSKRGLVKQNISDDGIVCSWDHLTSFAVLMALEPIESWTLSLITKIGLSISIVCLALAIITFCLCRYLHGPRTTIHTHLCISLFIANCLFLLGIESTRSKLVCGIVAGILHAAYLSAFCWMFLEGLQLYLMLVKVFKTELKKRYLLAVGYGVPLVIVAISAAAYSGGYGTNKYCWLSLDRGFIWSFMGPVCFIILVNCGIFVLTVWKLTEKMATISPEQGRLKRIRTMTVTSVAQLCILGCCWAFGFLMFSSTKEVFAYLFTICNSLQGVQIFFLHCIMHKKVREEYKRWFCAIAHFKSPLYSEFSNSSHINTQSKSKTSKESGI
ncbi:adhesion G protein-coupled receptor E5 isoform X2 [Hyperolius riggenbachi]|uniref:adhesion G protein-coupled receptor E5 isoform X2 n=1 Tax=Hyperolius riggenbachi TaxID=752182 RepID=UPI0035A36A90